MELASIAVSTFMTRDVKTAAANMTLQPICKIMHDNDIGSVIILDAASGHEEKGPVGIITERDVVRTIASNSSALGFPASQNMSKPLITIGMEATLAEALQIMQERNIRRLPVVTNNNTKLAGIITDKDILRRVMKETLTDETVIDVKLLRQMVISDQPPVYMLGEMLRKP